MGILTSTHRLQGNDKLSDTDRRANYYQFCGVPDTKINPQGSGEKLMKNEVYHVQETIGGWRQNSIFTGTLAECEEFFGGCNGNFTIVSDDEYEVDYID